MAKLGTYYGLCPLIDHRSVLGVHSDAVPGNVIVTLDKNIAVKYKISDQKQLHSWRTRDKFSSPVIYDTESSKYIAVFNQTYVRLWEGDEEDVDRLKKIKFKKQIYTITVVSGKCFVIFKNGAITTLNKALSDRKTFIPEDVISEHSEYIYDILYSTVSSGTYVGLLINANDNFFFTYGIFDDEDNVVFKRIQLKRDNVTLVGSVCHSNNRDNVQLLTLWSDGKMFSHQLVERLGAPSAESELFAAIESVSCKHPITMTSLNEHYIAMYGGSSNDEGASVIIYNVQFKVTQSKQIFKLFSIGARLWKIENYLLVCVGQNLAVVPFKLDVEQLAALVGSHKVVQDAEDDDISIVHNLKVASWNGEETMKLASSIPGSIKKDVQELSEQGWPENLICENLIPVFLEKGNVKCLLDSLNYFQDFPEEILVKLIKFCVLNDPKTFKPTKSQNELIPEEFNSPERQSLINKLLGKSFTRANLILHLRTLDLNEIILLLRYIFYLLSDEEVLLPDLDIVESENKLIEWTCALIDGNYQKIVLSRDADVIEILGKFLEFVNNDMSYFNTLQTVSPLLRELKNGKVTRKNQNSSYKYSIEQLTLY